MNALCMHRRSFYNQSKGVKRIDFDISLKARINFANKMKEYAERRLATLFVRPALVEFWKKIVTKKTHRMWALLVSFCDLNLFVWTLNNNNRLFLCISKVACVKWNCIIDPFSSKWRQSIVGYRNGHDNDYTHVSIFCGVVSFESQVLSWSWSLLKIPHSAVISNVNLMMIHLIFNLSFISNLNSQHSRM